MACIDAVSRVLITHVRNSCNKVFPKTNRVAGELFSFGATSSCLEDGIGCRRDPIRFRPCRWRMTFRTKLAIDFVTTGFSLALWKNRLQ